MATVSPSISTLSGVPRVVWSGIVTGDTITSFALTEQWGLAGSVQISGTFGGAIVTLQHSNDGTTWFDAKDLNNATVSTTTNGIFEVSLSSLYFRPAVSGGSGNAVNVIIVFRGLY
jgi:hypothetical protein